MKLYLYKTLLQSESWSSWVCASVASVLPNTQFECRKVVGSAYTSGWVDLASLSAGLGHDTGFNDLGTSAVSRSSADIVPQSGGHRIPLLAQFFCAGGDDTQHGRTISATRRLYRTMFWVPPSDDIWECTTLVGASCLSFQQWRLWKLEREPTTIVSVETLGLRYMLFYPQVHKEGAWWVWWTAHHVLGSYFALMFVSPHTHSFFA